MALSLEPDAHRPIVMFIQKPRIGTPTPLTAPPPRVSVRYRRGLRTYYSSYTLFCHIYYSCTSAILHRCLL